MSGELKKEQVLAIIKNKGNAKEKLLSILLAIQEASGWNYVDKEWAKLVATELEIPLTKVYDVLTFYAMFSTEPRGKYVIEICKSAPCHVAKADSAVQMFTEELGIKMGETTANNLFTLQYTSCFGACDLAPVVKIGEKVYGHLTREKVAEIIKTYREGSRCLK
ncbi:MAG: NAD(P)H-dependent oxidoreductase subunit E [Clostridia bacterium]|jgi:NADH-quinone oxidoreductase subunit E|nr:NAD(P)H-dependent oxidoreductase subunit E [Clostridia bacterium]MDD4145582.1 NAD(P)H-dependent oxidoreductase subunit E [Clostridia bacterium]MDD4665971.1 NAD(P)H-dependent oxidoreductase subunit E [Clostridia bacterium]